MERPRYISHGRASALAQQQMEAERDALRAQAEKEREEAGERKEQYWVRFKQITISDINALLEIYERLKKYSPTPIDEGGFERLCKEFISDLGIGTFPIQTGSSLEARRRIGVNGELFVRFKISGGHACEKDEMQEEIDAYFLSKKMAVPLRKTY